MFHVPSIDQIFKFLKRPINAVGGLTKFSGYYIINFYSYTQVCMLVLKFLLFKYSRVICDPWWALLGNLRSVDVMQASRSVYQQV
jgi:hypothetical protein